jgi:hypothetical protein
MTNLLSAWQLFVHSLSSTWFGKSERMIDQYISSQKNDLPVYCDAQGI